MGYFKIDDIIFDEIATKLKPSTTLLLIFLIRASGKNGTSFYGQAKIAAMLNMSRRTVIRSTEELRKEGLVTIKIRKGENKSSIYTLCQKVTRVVQISHKPCAKLSHEGRHQEGKQNKEVNAYGFIPDS